MKDYPLIKISILFLSGILCQKYITLNFQILVFIFGLSFLFLLLFLFSKADSRLISFFCVAVSVITAGALSFNLSDAKIIPYPFHTSRLKDVNIYGSISEMELEKDSEFRFTLLADSVKLNNIVQSVKIKILCKVKDENKKPLDSVFNSLKIGNYVSLSGTLSKAREIRNPGEFDYQKYLEIKGYSAVFYCGSASELGIIRKSTDYFNNLIFELRKSIDKTIQSYHDSETSALLRGLLLADRSEISDEVETDFVNTGVVHILAVSGSNVLFFSLIFIFLFGRFGIYLRTILLIIGIICFLIITGTSPSVFRAVIMAVTVLVSLLSNRGMNLYNSLALSALILLLLDPQQLFDPGFQLSFAAVISIAAIGRLLVKNIRLITTGRLKVMRPVLIYVAVTLAAQIGTLPFTLFYFRKLSIIAPVANLVVIPLMGVITGCGIVTLCLNPFWGWAAGIYAGACNALTVFVYSLTNILSNVRYSFLYIREFSFIDSLYFYCLIILLFIFFPRLKTLKARIVFPVLAFMLILILIRSDESQLLPANNLSIAGIDIGQGDATLVKFSDGRTALIDAGLTSLNFDNGEKIILPLINYLGIEQIDYGFISHIDMDHYSGFISLVNKGVIKKIYKPPLDTGFIKDVKLERFLKKMHVPFEYYSKGIINTGSSRIYILNNSEDFLNRSFSRNDKSAILKIAYGNTSLLFTGDAGKIEEELLTNRYRSNLKSDLLKLGHHGSKNSSSIEFLSHVNPDIALISCGVQNRFGHPAQIVLQRLRQLNISTLRTDLEGAIILTSDGTVIQRVNWRNK